MPGEAPVHATHEAVLGAGALDLRLGENDDGFAFLDLGVQLAGFLHARLHASGESNDQSQGDDRVRPDVEAVHGGFPSD